MRGQVHLVNGQSGEAH